MAVDFWEFLMMLEKEKLLEHVDVHSHTGRKLLQSLEHSSWEMRNLHSCDCIHACRNLGTSGESSVIQRATSVYCSYNAVSMQCNVNALFGIHLLR